MPMTDSRWELMIVLILASTVFFAVWHIIAWLLG
jgi:hypothetical protein